MTSEGAETPDIGRRGGLADYHPGNLVDDPELTLHPHRHRRRHLRVPSPSASKRWRVRDGETSFFKVSVWRGHSEHLADSLSKGDG